MEFWGVEVKNGSSVRVEPGEDMIVHISQIALGESKDKGIGSVCIYLKVGDQKLIIGTLSHEKFPQLSTEIVLEKGFELSHTWKNGSVYVSGYKVDASDPEADGLTEEEPAVASDKEPAVAKSGVKQVNFKLPNEVDKAKQDDDDSDDDSEDDDMTSSEDSGDEEGKLVSAGDDSEDESDDEDDEDESSDDDTPKKKPVETKKRPADGKASKNPTSDKKAKFVTPQKTGTETKKTHHVHIATPHPAKQAGKNSGSNGEASKQQQQKTPKSAGTFGCKSCNRSFTSEMGLQSHTKAKHSAAAT